MQRQATPKFFSAAGKHMRKKRARLKNFCINTDHLGNTRVSFQDADGNGSIDTENEVVEVNDYYPFGLTFERPNTVIGSTNLGQKFKYNGVELNETLDLYEMPFRQYSPEIARFTSIDPVTHFDFSTYNAFDNNPAFWADPSGANAGTTTGTTVDLEEVVVTAPNKSENVPAWFYGSTSWTSDYKGNLQDYNSEFGTNYTYADAINPYNQWMYEHFYKPQYDDMISSMHEATSMAAELTLYVLPTPLAVAGSLRALPALGTGLVRFNKVANATAIKTSLKGDLLFNFYKRQAVGQLSKQVQNLSFANKRTLVKYGGNDAKKAIQNFANHNHTVINYQTYESVMTVREFYNYAKHFLH